MHEKNIQLLAQEAVRLLEYEKEILDKISVTQGVLSGESQGGSFTKETIHKDIAVLEGESYKLKNMDMVVAVVGTMKAGKSTTINAIVGFELLPNRSAAATSLPTLIRHVSGQKPVLHFAKNAPINDLISQLRNSLTKNQSTFEDLKRSRNTSEFVDFIESEQVFNDRYEGEEEIHRFLRILNELARQANLLDLTFPFGEYESIQDLPVIEVEFAHLHRKEDSLGRLALLDTPGPNEAGQRHMAKMLQKQLEKASAVLAVLNYTQLGSAGDEGLRIQLKSIAAVAGGRMYALINRIDSMQANDPDIEETLDFTSRRLFDGLISVDKIYPTAANKAFLAQRIKAHMNMGGTLPDPTKPDNKWFEDFARGSMGTMWKRLVNDEDAVREASELYWAESGFDEPINRVIVSAHSRAAHYALDSAASKLNHYADRIANFIDSRGIALQKSTQQLLGYIEELRSDIENITKLQESASNNAEKAFQRFEHLMAQQLDNIKQSVLAVTKQYFQEGKADQNQALEDAKKAQQKRRPNESIDHPVFGNLTILNAALGNQNVSNKKGFAKLFATQKKKHAQFDEDKQVLIFSEQSKAEDFVGKIESAFTEPFEKALVAINSSTQTLISDFEFIINRDVVESSQAMLNQITSRMKAEGFTLHFSAPKQLKVRSEAATGSKIQGGIIASSKQVTRHKAQDGFFGGFKRSIDFFDAGWGYDEVSETVPVFRVSMPLLEMLAEEAVHAQVKVWHEEVIEVVQQPLSLSLEEFFSTLMGSVERVRGDLQQGIADQQESTEKQQQILKSLEKLKKPAQEIKEDTEYLEKQTKDELESLSS